MATARLLIISGAIAAICVCTALAAQSHDTVRSIELPLKLPAVGNVDGVKQWRFGRIEQAIQAAGETDVLIDIRVETGDVVRITAPGPPLDALARASNWTSDARQRTGRSNYVERMIAFDVDGDGRLIAMMSLEPIDRNRNRLARALNR